MNKKQIAQALDEIALLLELKGENHFKIRSYSNGSRILQNSQDDLPTFIEKAQNGNIKGIGEALSDKIQLLYETGSSPYLESLRAEFPDTLLDILKVPGLGAKKVKALYTELNVDSLEALEAACADGSIATLDGFGAKTVENILSGIKRIKTFAERVRYPVARECADSILQALSQSKLATTLEVAGSLRRCCETIGDIDIVAVSSKPEKLMELFVSLPEVASVTGHGETKSSVVLKNGIAVDLRVIAKNEFPATLQYFSGNKDHNTALRGIAKKKGLTLNEYGLFKGEKPLSISSEADIYEALELCYISPELREGRDEIELAQSAYEEGEALPELVQEQDIKGVLHAHTTYSDGAHSLRELATAVKEMGYQYLGITDHSQSARYANGLDASAIKKQFKEIDELNKELAPFVIFKGIESDILADGELDYSDTLLEKFDFIIASIHSRFSMSEAEMTERVIKAVQNPYTTILGHPTGRLLLKREPYAINLHAVLEAAAEHGVAVELNANPQRFDLEWRLHQKAVELGIKIPICPDAHSIEGVGDIRYGIGIARKGGLTKADVLNTMTAKRITTYFARKRER